MFDKFAAGGNALVNGASRGPGFEFVRQLLAEPRVARCFESLLAHRERAVVANLSARVGSIGDNRLGGWYAYRGAEAAQNMLTRTLAIECARTRRNVICLALHPGTTDTDRSRPLQANVPADRLFVTERSVRQFLGSIDRLQHTESDRFCGCNGESIPW